MCVKESAFYKKKMGEGEENGNEADSNERTLALSPTWSVAIVLTVFVVVSVIVERSIYRLSTWLRKTKRKPMFSGWPKISFENEVDYSCSKG